MSKNNEDVTKRSLQNIIDYFENQLKEKDNTIRRLNADNIVLAKEATKRRALDKESTLTHQPYDELKKNYDELNATNTKYMEKIKQEKPWVHHSGGAYLTEPEE